METTQDYVMVSLKLLGALGLLIYGMRMMSDVRCAVVVGNDGDDCFFRISRTADAGAGHLSDYGC